MGPLHSASDANYTRAPHTFLSASPEDRGVRHSRAGDLQRRTFQAKTLRDANLQPLLSKTQPVKGRKDKKRPEKRTTINGLTAKRSKEM